MVDRIVIGKEYKVVEVENSSAGTAGWKNFIGKTLTAIKNDRGGHVFASQHFAETRERNENIPAEALVEVEYYPTEVKRDFKVGDKVRRIAPDGLGLKRGFIYTVKRVKDNWLDVEEKHDAKPNNIYPFMKENFVLVETPAIRNEPVSVDGRWEGKVEEFKEEKKMEIEKPKTQLEKTACNKAKEEAIKRAIEDKQKAYNSAMSRLIKHKADIDMYKKFLAEEEEKYSELAKKLGVSKEDEKQLF